MLVAGARRQHMNKDILDELVDLYRTGAMPMRNFAKKPARKR